MLSRGSPVRKPFGVLLLIVLTGVLADEAFVHTDDGCRVETHCLACRLTVGTAAVTVNPDLALGPALKDAGRVGLVGNCARDPQLGRRELSRGPPLT